MQNNADRLRPPLEPPHIRDSTGLPYVLEYHPPPKLPKSMEILAIMQIGVQISHRLYYGVIMYIPTLHCVMQCVYRLHVHSWLY